MRGGDRVTVVQSSRGVAMAFSSSSSSSCTTHNPLVLERAKIDGNIRGRMDINSVHVCAAPFRWDDAPSNVRVVRTLSFMMLMSLDCYPVDLLCPTRPFLRLLLCCCCCLQCIGPAHSQGLEYSRREIESFRLFDKKRERRSKRPKELGEVKRATKKRTCRAPCLLSIARTPFFIFFFPTQLLLLTGSTLVRERKPEKKNKYSGWCRLFINNKRRE